MKVAKPVHSATRLRLGFVFIILFWLPIWLLAPAVSALLGYSDDAYARHIILVIMACVQGVFGVIGAVMVGKEILPVFKKVPHRKVPITVWRIMRAGSFDSLGVPTSPKDKSQSQNSSSSH